MAKEELKDENKTKLPLCPPEISFPYNTTFLITNAIFFITAALCFVTFAAIHYKTDECNRFVTTPGIFLSFSLLTLSVTGFYAAYFKSDCLFRIYFFFAFLWILVVISKAVVVICLRKETTPRMFPRTHINEYRFEDYSAWIRRLIIKQDEWHRTKRCLIKHNTCKHLFSHHNISLSEFNHINLPPIQSGCCKPPLSCGFTYEKVNKWNNSKYNYNNLEDDCKKWSNSADTLCFDCNSCKAVIIADINHSASSISFNVSQILFSLLVNFIGWFAWARIKKTHNNI